MCAENTFYIAHNNGFQTVCLITSILNKRMEPTRVPICGALVKSTGKICQCRGSTSRGGRCGRHDPTKYPLAPRTTFVSFECSICMEDCSKTNDQHVTKCNHKFHSKCIHKWKHTHRKYTCPLCRTDLRPPPSLPVNPTPSFPTNMSVTNRLFPVPGELFRLQPHETWNDGVNRVAAMLLPERPAGSYEANSSIMHQAVILDIWQEFNTTLTASIQFNLLH